MIPKIKELEIPLLKLLAEKSPRTWDECSDELSNSFNLSSDERNLLMPNGKCGAMKYRVGWAKAYLKKRGLVETYSRGVYGITPKGRLYISDSKTV